MAAKYPPYMNAHGYISKVFPKIKTAAVPAKFTYDFLKTVLGIKSSSAQAIVPLLKRLGFLDAASMPTQVYKDYRDVGKSEVIMAERIRSAYPELYQANEYAHKLSADELKNNLVTVLGVEKSDPNAGAAVSTFMELVKLADFDAFPGKGEMDGDVKKRTEEAREKSEPLKQKHGLDGVEKARFGISYTINLNLPATTDIQVFNAIFKSLRDTIIDSN